MAKQTTLIKVSESTLKRLKLAKIDFELGSYDKVINLLLNKALLERKDEDEEEL